MHLPTRLTVERPRFTDGSRPGSLYVQPDHGLDSLSTVADPTASHLGTHFGVVTEVADIRTDRSLFATPGVRRTHNGNRPGRRLLGAVATRERGHRLGGPSASLLFLTYPPEAVAVDDGSSTGMCRCRRRTTPRTHRRPKRDGNRPNRVAERETEVRSGTTGRARRDRSGSVQETNPRARTPIRLLSASSRSSRRFLQNDTSRRPEISSTNEQSSPSRETAGDYDARRALREERLPAAPMPQRKSYGGTPRSDKSLPSQWSYRTHPHVRRPASVLAARRSERATGRNFETFAWHFRSRLCLFVRVRTFLRHDRRTTRRSPCFSLRVPRRNKR